MGHSKEILKSIITDDLTGLPTKEQHKARAVVLLSRRGKMEKYAYVSCDIVDFKVFNETYGYAYGNVALKHTANVWNSLLQKDELLSRTTQDHFCMLLHYENETQLRTRLSDMLEQAMDFPVDQNGGSHRAAFRCGVYLIREDVDINRIRSRAEMARRSRENTRCNTIAFYDGESLARELEIKELEADISRGLKEKEMEVYYQPKYDIATETISGAEALIRWKHPKKGMISPGQFIPICEENGFICELDFYVLEEVCKKIREWMQAGKRPIKISVNFSRVHMRDAYFTDKLVALLAKYQLDSSLIEIELTETAAYQEMERLLTVMKQIKKAGFALSMDDFGSGYSSLNLLREMPLDVLKLDKGFLDNCAGDGSSREKQIISHVISMAKDLGIAVLAEGVETRQQKEFLKESRCDMIQGYYYAMPMPADQFSLYLEEYIPWNARYCG